MEMNFTSTEVVRLNQQALDLGHHILVFPQGTRSLRLTKGHIGIAQMTQCLGIDVVPVACMGSEKAYPGNSPFARRGSIRYVVGKPLRVDGPELAELRIEEKLSHSVVTLDKVSPSIERITAIIMDHINRLLEPEYQWAEDDQANNGAQRFV